ncbi:HEAT repeat domain-containing protein [Tengunoibacter tsumagoiensis]|uniref:HEAT repeat domain-containing protein n=1 Tax=Tengunoibacter tsumagoiensis TaxID=2014871 RepID=A0A401ZTT9_9CHLR|nr:HEAT repeat domain-containing protein [Tengunoibacter tsumagoiensis]GCE10222.1 hypothetical protein KTT_00810 [Tengunoibacter tsumagoiensis]
MENETEQQPEPATIDGSATGVQAPASLLATVLSRIEQQEEYEQRVEELSVLRQVQLLSHTQWELRVAALEALSAHPNEALIDPLLIACHDDEPQVRVAAIQALGALGSQAPLEQFVLSLRDQDWQVREMTVLTLGQLAMSYGQTVMPLLKSALQDTSSSVRVSAQSALEYAQQSIEVRTVQKQQLRPFFHGVYSLSLTGQAYEIFYHAMLVFRAQLTLMIGRWKVPALLLLLSYAAVLFVTMAFDHTPGHQAAATSLTLVCLLSTMLGIAFTIDIRAEEGMEIALATPTSLRLLLFSRFLGIVSLNTLAASGASVMIALLYQQGFWGILQLWLEPLCLIASVLLVLTILVGAWWSCLSMFLYGLVQAQRLNEPIIPLIMAPQWQFCLMIICLVVAFSIAPCQIRGFKEL